MKIDCAHDELVPVEQIIESPRNYNKHSARQIDMLAKIINYQGQRSPIVVSKRSGFVVCGAGRLKAIKKLGWDKAAVNYQDFDSEAQELAHLTADNKIAELAETDHDMLLEIGISLGEDFDHELMGLDVELHIPKEITNTSSELDLSSFDNFQHQCPKCGFEWNDNGTT